MFMQFFLLLIAFGLSLEDDAGPIIETPLGSVQGFFKKSYGGRTFSSFEGIPFAGAPVGKLRFADPQPPEPWDGTLAANTTYSCLAFSPFQFSLTTKNQEDCLYLYVYVPREKINPNEGLDVVVHIHGGGFSMGAPTYLAGPDYLMDKDVVFVTFNYRLAMLGFMSTEDDVVSGNMGLKDQTMGLRWVKEYIRFFGGNPDSVTLTGLSAGAASVHFHYLSPSSKGLFHRGLSQSGHALLPWSLSHNNLNKAKKIGEYFNCTTDDNAAMIDCLRDIDENELIKAQSTLYIYMDAIPFPIFAPTIEKGKNAFISTHPYKLLKEGKVYDVPWIASNTKDEGIFPTCIFVFLHILADLDSKWNELAPHILQYAYTANDSDMDVINKKVRQYYLQNQPMSYDNTDPLVKMFTDRLFLIDTEKMLKLHSKIMKAPLYYYFFEYVMDESFFLYSQMKKGAAHGDDSRFFLKVIGGSEKLSESDEKMMKLFTDFIVTYARTSVPTFKNLTWDPVEADSENIDYLDIITPDDVKMKAMKHLGPLEFWDNLPLDENERSLE